MWRAVASLVLLSVVVPEARGADESLVGSRVRIRASQMGEAQVGAGVGSLIKTERWERVPAGGVSVGIGPGPGGLQAQIVVRFKARALPG